jgi:signal transduction histidine kinase
MSSIAQALEAYIQLVEKIILAGDNRDAERYLMDAFELGRSLVSQQVSPDEVVGLHDDALIHLARTHPDLPLGRVAERLTKPLMELSMAYGLAFREQMAQRYEAMIDARLEQSNKLEAVGMLAAGIAHDFNNIVGSIVGFTEMTGEALAPDAPAQSNIRQVLLACHRASDLVKRMLAFARQETPMAVWLELVTQVREALVMLSAAQQARVSIAFETRIDQAFVMAGPGQIQQIVANLCINAADAMANNGQIVIGLKPARAVTGVPPGHEHDVCLTVADSGCGMTPEVQSRAFDPFFTTKAQNGGSGLGLSVVYGIVKDMGGRIEIRSRSSGPARGTEFRIFLPLAAEMQPGAPSAASVAKGP